MAFLLTGNSRQLRFTGEFKANTGDRERPSRQPEAEARDGHAPDEKKLGQLRVRKTTARIGQEVSPVSPPGQPEREALGQLRASHRAGGAPRPRLDTIDDDSPTALLERDDDLAEMLAPAPTRLPPPPEVMPARPAAPLFGAHVANAPILRLHAPATAEHPLTMRLKPYSAWLAGAVVLGGACYFVVPELFALFN